MSDIEPLLAAIEDNPVDDLAWQILADWLEERGEPSAEVLRRTIADRTWREGFDEVSRGMSLRTLQLAACDIVEPLLPIFEGRNRRDRVARRLVEGLRASQALAEIRSYNMRFVRWSWHERLAHLRLNPLDVWLAEAATACWTHLVGWPRRACVQAAEALAVQKSGILPSRSTARKNAEAIRAAQDVEFRRVIVKALRHHLDASGR